MKKMIALIEKTQAERKLTDLEEDLYGLLLLEARRTEQAQPTTQGISDGSVPEVDPLFHSVAVYAASVGGAHPEDIKSKFDVGWMRANIICAQLRARGIIDMDGNVTALLAGDSEQGA